MKARYEYRDVWVGGYLKRFWLNDKRTGYNKIMLNWTCIREAEEFYTSWED